MNQKIAAITLDLEPDNAGQTKESYEGWKINYLDQLFSLLESYDTPLTVFLVGKSIIKHRDAIRFMQKNRAQFHLHSYSHDRNHPDIEYEISQGVKAYRRFFGVSPTGYRAPEGRITLEGFTRLKQQGFLFDSSVFPSFWPHPRYLFFPKSPYQTPSGIFEIPITTIGPLRIIFSLSWIKLIGWNWYRSLLGLYNLPNIVIFNFHMHDLYSLSSYSQLPMFWKFIYSRNRERGVELFDNVLRFLKERGYLFVHISTVFTKKLTV